MCIPSSFLLVIENVFQCVSLLLHFCVENHLLQLIYNSIFFYEINISIYSILKTNSDEVFGFQN